MGNLSLCRRFAASREFVKDGVIHAEPREAQTSFLCRVSVTIITPQVKEGFVEAKLSPRPWGKFCIRRPNFESLLELLCCIS